MDLILTSILLLFIVSLIVIPINRGKVMKGHIGSIQWSGSLWLHRLLSKFPRSVFGQACFFALVGLLFISPVTLLVIYGLGIDEMSVVNFVIFKAVWAGLMAGVMVGPMILVAIQSDIDSINIEEVTRK